MNPERNLLDDAVDPDSPPVTKHELDDFADELEGIDAQIGDED